MRAKGKKLLLALLLICGIMAAFAGCTLEDPTNENEPVTYKITYVLNGGEGDALGAFEEGVGLSALPVPTKAGNTFAGWYTTSDFSGEAVTSIAADAVSDVTLYAKWTPNTYSVNYSNLAGGEVSLTEGAPNAVYGTDYSFTLVETGEIPAIVTVTIGGSPIDVQPVENVYTIEGEEIVGDISVTVSISHVKVTYRQAEHVSYGENALLAEKNAPFTFTVNAEQGYVITEVSVTQEGGSPVPVTGENGTYSFAVTDKAITVSATVRAVRYTIEFDNGEETFAQTLSAEYGQDVTLTDVGSLDGFVPEHYTFEGWSLTPNGEKAYDDGATVRNLTVIDGDTVTLYAVLTAEQFTVTVGETSGFELSDLPEATYGQDYVVRISDADSYVYDITAKIGTREQKLEYDDVRGVFVLDSEYVTDDIAISGEKYVADPAVYENVTPYVIADQFANGNEYKVYATLTEEGILFRLDAKQHSLHRAGGENVLFSDGIRFQLGRKDGSAKSSAGQYFGVNVDGYIGGTDTSRAVAKVSGESGAYEYTLEGLMPVSAILNADLGYTAADFSAENLANTRVYVGMLIINFNNHKSYQDTVYSPNAQYRYSYNGSWGMPVGEIGKGTDDAANTSIISVGGIESAIAKDGVDGVISENEYGSHALEYTNGSNANYMKLYGKRTDDGMYLAVQVRTNTVVYFNGASPSGCPENVDYMQFGWYSPTYQKYVNYRLYPDGHIADSDQKYDYFLKGLTTAVLIDKSNAGSFTTKTQGNAAGLVAGDNGYFVTTYEIYIPNGIMDLPQQSDGSDVYSDLYVLFRHRCDQIGESGDTNAFDGKDTSGGTTWFYTNEENVGAWPEQPYATVTPDGIFDLNRTFVFDNTATGNTEQTFSEMAVKAYSDAVLPVPTAQIGYRFVGWATEPNGEPIDTAGGVPLVGKPDSEGKVTLYAVYEEAKYAFSVTDENELISDITGVTDGNTVLLGQDITFRVNAPSDGMSAIATVTIGGIEYPIEPKDGLYTIAGEAVTGDIVVTVTVTQSEEPVTYKITYVLNGGEGAALGAFEEGIGLSSLPVPTKAGNTFAGWYTTSDFSGEAVTSIAADAVSDVTLYAKWTPNTYSVNYSNLAGGEVSLTEGAPNAVYGTDYSFTLVETGEIPAIVTVTIGGSPIDVQPVENVYTIEGEEIVGDISVTVSISHVKVTYRQAEHVSYGENALLAEKNAPFTFTVNAEQGYVITEVSVTQEGGSPVPVTGENGTYSFAVTDKAITVSATVRAVRYTIEFDNGEETFAQTLSAEYGQDVTLTDVGSLDGFVPEHYTFEGWSLTPNGEKAYDDGATVRNLTVIDGDTVTLYAVLTAEQFTVTVGETSGFELSDLPEATYGQDYVVRISDADSYVYDITAKIGTREQKLEYDDVRGVFVLDSEYVTDDIAISGEKYVADPAVYENVTPYVIADQFANGNEYKVYATLTEEGILFRLDAKQHSLHRAGGENVLFSDGIRFQLGRKDGSAKSSAGQYFGVNVDGYIGGTDTSRAVAKVSGESGAYEYTLEGLMPVSAILNADLGYTAADFSAENLANTRVYVGMLIINFNNHKSYQDTVYSPNAQYRYSYNGSWGMPVGEIGKGTDDAANTSIISVGGIESAIAKDGVDGVISENEYGSHALEYTNGSNANYMKLYGKRTDDGMYLAVQVRTNTVVYFNGASPSGCPENVDYMQFGWYSPTYQKYVNYRLYPDGHIADSDQKYDYFLKGLTTAVLIDKSNAGSFTTKTQGNAAGLVAGDNGYFVTTYEIYIPNGIMDLPQQSDGSDVYSDLYVLFRHRCDQIGESGDTNAFDGKDTSGGTTWFYTNEENVGAWPEQPYATVTPDGIFDLNRTFVFDNTATGNTEQTFSEMAVKAYSDAVLPVPTAQIGYRFVGWATEPNGEPIDTAGGVPLVGKPDSEGKVTLYAVYEEAKYAFSVTDENELISDITGVTDGNTVLLGQDITFRVNAPSDGMSAIATVTIGGIEYPIEPKDGLYTIAGEAVTGDIVVTVTVTQSAAYRVEFTDTDNVTFSGNTEAYPDVDYRFTADVAAEDYYLAVIVTDADGSVIPVEKINETTYRISGAEIAGDITITEKPHEILSGTFDFELAGFTYGGVASPASAVLIDGEDYSAAFSFSDGQYTVAENALADLSVGQTYRLIMETEDKVYEQQFLFVTMVINDLDEFRLIQSKYYKGTKAGQAASTDTSQYRDGYFVLAADINKGGEYFEFTMSPGWTDDGTGAPSGDEMARLGWYGTLDGRGHAIYNVQAGAGGMFGILTSQSVLKNVAVIGGKTVTGGKFIVPETGEEHANSFAGANAKNTGFLTRAIAGGTVSNVYIEMADMPQIDRFGTLAFIVKGGAHLEKIIIRICASSVSATDRHAAYGLAYENSVADSLYVFGAVQNGAAGSAKADETPYLARNFNNLVAGYDVYGVGSYSELYMAKEDALTSFGSVWDFTENSVSFGSYVYTEEVV